MKHPFHNLKITKKTHLPQNIIAENLHTSKKMSNFALAMRKSAHTKRKGG